MGRSTEKHLAMHTSKPATFSINIRLGAHPCFARSGNTCSMRWRKDLALGSSAPLAPGLRTVYGWQDGESNQRDASSSRSSKASRVEISVCLDNHKVISLKNDLELIPSWLFPCRNSYRIRDKRVGPSRKRVQPEHQYCYTPTRNAIHLLLSIRLAVLHRGYVDRPIPL